MQKGVLIDSNERKIDNITTTILHTIDRVVSSNKDGILTKPTTGSELSEFNETVTEVVVNKLRNKLGV